jgi:hypothetical protein
VLVASAAVGAVGLPVNDGDSMGARDNISALFFVINKESLTIRLESVIVSLKLKIVFARNG